MIPFRFGKLRDALRRAFCVVLAALISLNLTLPAFAASGQLQTVGWAETVSSFLMSCGIYPYDTDENGNFTEWSAQSLTALWDEFQKDVTGVAYDIVDVTSSLAKGVIAIASGRWSVLREFATWIVNKYNVTDNQMGVQLGLMVGGFSVFAYPFSSTPTFEQMRASGFFVGRNVGNYIYYYYGTVDLSEPVYLFCVRQTGVVTGYQILLVCRNIRFVQYFGASSNNVTGNVETQEARPYGGVYVSAAGAVLSNVPSYVSVVYESLDSAVAAFLSYDGPDFSGITADTTTISIPDALPEGTQFGGLTVQGAGEGVTLEQLQGLIRDAVQDALKPAVNVVPVVVAPNVDVDANGEISTDLDINPSTVPMTASDYSAPNITGVFPFSIPWDVIAILSALNAEPVRPDFQVSIYVPVLDIHVPFHIGVNAQDAQAVDSAFAVWRNMLLVLMCVGTLLLFAKLLL